MINNLGDINQDGSLNILDLVGIINVILLGTSPDGLDYAFWASDVNLDAAINILDIVALIDIILGN